MPKTYLAEVTGVVGPAVLRRLREGLTLEDGPVRPTSVKLISTATEKSLIKITLQEGRNRIVRRTMEAVGHPVRRLSRTGIGPVRLGNLKIGEVRELTRDELGGAAGPDQQLTILQLSNWCRGGLWTDASTGWRPSTAWPAPRAAPAG